jgi:regulator of protease activity HflC (stomatin/prohibitin superfamily)
MSDRFLGWFMGTVTAVIILSLIVMALLWTPLVGPWAAERRGMAELRQAQQNRQILVEQAEAQQQVSIIRAQAEKEASELRAEAIAIIGEAAQRYPEYRQQEFIGAFAVALEEGSISQIIYVPTEANIPILEAGSGRVQ